MIENWRDGNEIELLINGEEFFPSVFEAIRNARQEVLLETFIFRDDQVGQELQQVLIGTAQRGVHVEITVDDYGTDNLSKAFIASLTQAGVKFNLFDPSRRIAGFRFNIFRRLHRKIVVVDAEIAFVGGINYSADHLASFGPEAKQDYAVQVRGPIVQDIHRACLLLLSHRSVQKQKKLQEFPLKPVIEKVGKARALFALRDNIKHTTDIERHYLRAIHAAKHRLTIANAYFFPGYRLLRAIRLAAQRGVKVTLIMQGQPDMLWVTTCTRLLYGYFLRRGVIILEYKERPLHGKVALVDDNWSTVGSSNLDPLSLALNLEGNLVIEDKAFNDILHNHLEHLAEEHCKPINIKVATRGNWWRVPFIFLSFHFLRYFPAIARWFPAQAPYIKLIKAESEKTPRHDTIHDVEKIT